MTREDKRWLARLAYLLAVVIVAAGPNRLYVPSALLQDIKDHGEEK